MNATYEPGPKVAEMGTKEDWEKIHAELTRLVEAEEAMTFALPVSQVSRLTGLHPKTLIRRVRSGRIRGIKRANGYWAIPFSEVCSLMSSSKVQAVEEAE